MHKCACVGRVVVSQRPGFLSSPQLGWHSVSRIHRSRYFVTVLVRQISWGGCYSGFSKYPRVPGDVDGRSTARGVMCPNPETSACPHERMCGRCSPHPLVVLYVAFRVTLGFILPRTSTGEDSTYECFPTRTAGCVVQRSVRA